MTSLREVTQAIADVLTAAIDIANIPLDVQVSPLRILKPSPPCLDVYPADPFTQNEDAGFGDPTGSVLFTVRARIGTSDNDAGQEFLLSLMDDNDPLCVNAALIADETLNGTVTSSVVIGPSGHQIYEDVAGLGAFIGISWTVKVIR